MNRRPRTVNLAAIASGHRHTRPVNRMQTPQARSWYRIQNAADGSTAEINIYDEIGYFGTTAAQFVDELGALDVAQINVHVNTPGGDAYDGIAIYNALVNHPAGVTTYVEALAASIGSIILQAGDVRVARSASQVMIHDAWGMCVGNAADMTECADMLDKASNMLAQVYADRTGGSAATWRAAMKAETWYSSDEAQGAGLVDAVQGKVTSTEGDGPSGRFDLSVFNYAGRELAPPPPRIKLDTKALNAAIREAVR